jgi:hypothetical protein
LRFVCSLSNGFNLGFGFDLEVRALGFVLGALDEYVARD